MRRIFSSLLLMNVVFAMARGNPNGLVISARVLASARIVGAMMEL